MKALVISLIVFALLSLTIIANFIYVNNAADELQKLTRSLALDTSDKSTLEKINKKWEKASFILSFSVNYREMNSMDELLLSLNSAYEAKKEYEFELYKVLIIDCIDDLKRLERFSAENIF